MYYDQNGSVISEADWSARWADDQYRLLARTDMGEWAVVAWWAGFDDDPGGPAPRVFRSGLMAVPRHGSKATPLLGEWRHRTTEAALRHHDTLVAQIQGDAFAGQAGVAGEDELPSDSSHCCG